MKTTSNDCVKWIMNYDYFSAYSLPTHGKARPAMYSPCVIHYTTTPVLGGIKESALNGTRRSVAPVPNASPACAREILGKSLCMKSTRKTAYVWYLKPVQSLVSNTCDYWLECALNNHRSSDKGNVYDIWYVLKWRPEIPAKKYFDCMRYRLHFILRRNAYSTFTW